MPGSAPRWCRHEHPQRDSTPTALGAAGMRTIPRPLAVLARGAGARVWDVDGTEYLDFLAGIAVNSLGHAHPVFVDAVSAQAATLAHVSNYFATEPEVELAERLLRLTGGQRPSSATRAPRRSKPRSSWRGAPGDRASWRSTARSTAARPEPPRSPARQPCASRSCPCCPASSTSSRPSRRSRRRWATMSRRCSSSRSRARRGCSICRRAISRPPATSRSGTARC